MGTAIYWWYITYIHLRWAVWRRRQGEHEGSQNAFDNTGPRRAKANVKSKSLRAGNFKWKKVNYSKWGRERIWGHWLPMVPITLLECKSHCTVCNSTLCCRLMCSSEARNKHRWKDMYWNNALSAGDRNTISTHPCAPPPIHTEMQNSSFWHFINSMMRNLKHTHQWGWCFLPTILIPPRNTQPTTSHKRHHHFTQFKLWDFIWLLSGRRGLHAEGVGAEDLRSRPPPIPLQGLGLSSDYQVCMASISPEPFHQAQIKILTEALPHYKI